MILITGQNGFIARHLTKKLYDLNYEVSFLNRGDDIQCNPTHIFHLAAEVYDNEKMFETNVLLTHKILEFCRCNPSTKMILFGSSSEYGRKNTPILIEDSLYPHTIYEGTKCAASMLAEAWSKTYGIKVTLIRPFTIFGGDENPKKLTSILYSKFKNNEKLMLTSGYHDYVYVKDFVDFIIKIAFFDEKSKFTKVSIGSGKQTSNEDFVRMCQRALDYTFNIELAYNKKVYDSELWVMNSGDLEYIKSKYNFEFKYTLESALKDMWN
jgi:nucleoside-diphosphate-sugar epimerase